MVRFLYAALILIAAMAAARAADAPAANPSTEEILRQLTPAPAPAAPARGRTRGIVIEHKDSPAPQPPAGPPRIALAINFEFNSAKLTTDAELILDRLAAALANPQLKDSHFNIAGHTDAKGGDDYNMKLSQQRAEAVMLYLERADKIEASRLSAVGYGRTRLLDPQHPYDGINRRVEITNLGVGS